MWLPLTLFVLAGVISAESNYGWKVGKEYTYLLQSRTFTHLHEFANDYAGILMKGLLTIQVKEDSKLTVKLWEGKYAHVNTNLTMGWDEDMSDLMTVFHDLPISEKPFDVKLDEGLINSVIVEKDVPDWEVVLLKSIISQLQVDTKGKQLVGGHEVKIPDENDLRGSFTVLEDYFTGLSEVRYDFKPLSEQQARNKPELVPKPDLKGTGQYIDIVKTKSYDRYPEMSKKVFGMPRQYKIVPKNKNHMSKSSTSRIVISGDLRNFVIQSAVSSSKTTITPKFNELHNSTVLSKQSLTLESVDEIKNPMPSPKNPKFTGYRISFETTPSPLENAPRDWSNVIDYEGKFMGKFGEVDGINAVKELVFQIANELVEPDIVPVERTMDKFIILVNIIRTMNRDQIAEAQGSMDISPKTIKWDDQNEAVKQNAWSVFRDAVTQSGTGPALLVIKSWVESGDMRNTEAAEILSKIPASARQITEKYTEAFFELATHPQVTKTAVVNVTAITAFSELLYQSLPHDKSIPKFYPVRARGRISEEQHSNIVNNYIPYLGVQLKKAVDDGDSARIQTYIVALGTIGMYEVLPVFEPFLTGREKLTAFQKTLMLASLSNFVANHPGKAQEGLMQIYANTTESYEVRCMAVFLIPMTNPSSETLREIVQISNHESNKQIKSAVKSTLQSLVNLEDPEWESLPENARHAMKLLDDNDYDQLKSHQYIFNKLKENNLHYKALFNYIGSDDNLIPRTIYLALTLYDGNFKESPLELMTMIPNIDSLIDALTFSDEQSLVKMATEKIAEELNIVGDKPIDLEGNLLLKTKFLSRFIPFDENTIRNLRNKIGDHLAAKKEGVFCNNHILNLNEMTIGDTTDTGLPFVYTSQESYMQKLTSIDDYKTGYFKSDFKFSMVQKEQRDIGFVTPFDRRHFSAGVERLTQVYVPLKISAEVSIPKKSVQIKMWTPKSNRPNRLLLRMQTPYTSIHNAMDLRSMLKQNDTRQLHISETKVVYKPLKYTRFTQVSSADESDEDVWVSKIGSSLSAFPMDEKHSLYHTVALVMNESYVEGEPIVLTVSYDTLDVKAGTEDASQWTQLVSAEFNEKDDTEQRKMRLLKEAAKGIQLAHAWVLDFQLQVPLVEQQLSNNLTVAWSMSNAETKGRFLFQLGVQDQLDEFKFDVCAATQLAVTPSYFPVYDEVNNSTPKVEIDVDARWGENCSDTSQLNILATGTRSKELKEEIDNNGVVKECKKQMEQGNKLLRVCQKAGDKALHMDKFDVCVKADPWSLSTIMEEFMMNVAFLPTRVTPITTVRPDEIDEDKIILKAKVSKNMKYINATLRSPKANMEMNDVSLDIFADSSEEQDDEIDNNWLVDEDTSTCVMDLNRAETFDGKAFPLKLSSCWQVLATTYPKRNPKNPKEKLAMSEDESVSILAREVNGQKEVKVILGRNEILLLPGSDLPEVMVNGKKVQVSGAVAHQVRQEDEIVAEIFQRGSHYVSVVADDFDIDLTYDGKRLMIESPEMFSYSLRGLCGNCDGDSENDFMSPGNCLLRQPEEFIASYTLIKDQCEGETLQKVKSLQKPACTTISKR